MKLHNLIIAFASGALLLGAASCSDSFLDEKMYSSYGTDNMKDANSKVLGLYYKVGALLGYSGHQGYLGCWQDGTDVGAPGDIQGVEEPFYNYTALDDQNYGVRHLWNNLYSIINLSNIILADETATPAYKGEAAFFRAWSYDQLVTFYGDVPLLTESVTTPSTDFTRTPVAEINKVMNEDIDFAIKNLPSVKDYSVANQSRINKDAARLLAAAIYLRQGMNQQAADAVTPTITEGNYKLIDKRYGVHLSDDGDAYSDMFRYGNQRRNQGNSEGIWTFEQENNANVPNGTIDSPQQRRNWVAAFHKLSGQMVNADSIGGRGNGRLRLSNYVKYAVFKEDGDIRNSNFNLRRILFCNDPKLKTTPLDVWVDANGYKVSEGTAGAVKRTLHYGDPAVWAYGDTLNVMYPHTTKWGAYDPTDDFGYAMVKDYPLMRFAEAYLLRAEAYVQMGQADKAAADINVLRDRAFKDYREATGNVEAGKVTASQMNLDFILDERIRELVGEENRRYTLVRTGKLAERVQMMVTKWPEATESKSIRGFDPNKHCLLPIPLTEIQLNKDAELKQNPGY